MQGMRYTVLRRQEVHEPPFCFGKEPKFGLPKSAFFLLCPLRLIGIRARPAAFRFNR